MELHHLRRFVILAEEQHFTRAAERLHIEPSPLSRSIKALEFDLGAALFHRDRRGTRLTSAGVALLQDARRLLTTLEQTREHVKAVAAGMRGNVHMAISHEVIDPRLSDFLARCREEEPEIAVHVSEVPLAEQLHGLRDGDFLLGLAQSGDVGADIIAEPLWQDRLVVAVPARHPLLAYQSISLHALAEQPLILCAPLLQELGCEWFCTLCHGEHAPPVVAQTTSQEMMLALVGAGYGLGFIAANRLALCRYPHVVSRPLMEDCALVTTYLLRLHEETPSALLDRLVTRLRDCANVGCIAPCV